MDVWCVAGDTLWGCHRMAKRCKGFLFWAGLVCLGVHTGKHTRIHNTHSGSRCIHIDRFGHTPKGPLTHTRLREGEDYTQQPQHLSISILTQADRTHRIVDSTASILREWKPRVRIDDRLIEPSYGAPFCNTSLSWWPTASLISLMETHSATLTVIHTHTRKSLRVCHTGMKVGPNQWTKNDS